MSVTLARPYAKAAFESACAHQTVGDWQAWLSELADAFAHDDLRKVLKNPGVSSKARVALLASVAKPRCQAQQRLLETMAYHHRLVLIPALVELFGQLLSAHRQCQDVRVASAFALDASVQAQVAKALQQWLGREVTCQFDVEPSLLGGMRCYVGDQVLDASVRHRLQQLKQQLLNSM